MVNRKMFPAEGACSILLTTEQMKDGGWAVVVTVRHSTESAHQDTDLPVSSQRFPTEAEAEQYGLSLAREWIEHNVSHLA